MTTATGGETVKEQQLFERMFAVVESAGWLVYGKSILWLDFLPLIDNPDRNDWTWRGQWISFCQLCREEGFIVTERGMNACGFRLLDREEMPSNVHNDRLRHVRAAERDARCLARVPRTGLSREADANIEYWQRKTTWIGQTVRSMLRSRTLPDK